MERGLFLIIHTASCCSFYQSSVIHDCLIKAEASSKVVCCIAITFENAAGNIASEPTLADHVNGLAGIHFVKTFSQLVNRNVVKALDMTSLIFSDCTGIKQGYAAISRKLIRSSICHCFTTLLATLSIIKPAIFTESFADEYGGA